MTAAGKTPSIRPPASVGGPPDCGFPVVEADTESAAASGGLKHTRHTSPSMVEDPGELSVGLLKRVRREESTDGLEETLGAYDPGELAAALDDPARLAFWCNVYNAYSQVLLDRRGELYEESRRRFFGLEAVPVAGRELSLNWIEHRLLRRSQFAWSLGYLANPLPGEFERSLRVGERDPRIHFALNCGAQSCPPIAAYTPAGIDEELDVATESYLSQHVRYEPDGGLLGRGVVHVPRLMLWYRGDFGGKSGVLSMLRRFDLIPDGRRPRLKHREYDWSLAPGQFREPFDG